MKKSRIRGNNRGDSLILVIGCTTLLSLLGIVVLSKTMDSRMMKLAEEKAQESFFQADSVSSQMVTVLEALAQESVELAFNDMMLEYSLQDTVARKDRFSEFFKAALEKQIGDPAYFKSKLEGLTTEEISNVEAEFNELEFLDSPIAGATKIVVIRDATFSYVANGSKTSITTDIKIQAKIPDVDSGFDTTVDCDFSDFALITDGNAASESHETMNINGNLYAGGDLHSGSADGANGAIAVNEADKVLVKKKIIAEEVGTVTIKNTTAVSEGEGVWANGIDVNGGTVKTNNTNLYISDDLSVKGINPTIEFKGSANEYVGYSGGGATDRPEDKSSAITINTINTTGGNTLKLDMSGLGKLYINGTSYIQDDMWKTDVEGLPPQEIDGIMQGESVAYKEMQAMYLVPGECLSSGYNPVIGTDEVNLVNDTFDCGDGVTLDLNNYVDPSTPLVSRVVVLDGGTTEVQYVYLNFANESAAVQFAKDYMATERGEEIKERIKNLGSTGYIKLATDVKTLAPSITYDGTALGISPEADAGQKILLASKAQQAKEDYKGYFSKLEKTGGVAPVDNLLKDKILDTSVWPGTADNAVTTVEVTTPNTYKFVFVNGNLTINGGTASNYNGMNGILLVRGNLTIDITNFAMSGLVLVCGDVKASTGATITANESAVEALMANDDVAKYFKGFTHSTTGSFLSSEAVDITFENWKKN